MKGIDVVITWVDGSDKKYKRKIQKYLSSFGSYKKQYLEANEIEYCVKSIIYYASFVRKIFIVSDSQTPKFNGIEDLLRKNKVKIVDHKEIFRGHGEYLPTFNPIILDLEFLLVPDFLLILLILDLVSFELIPQSALV